MLIAECGLVMTRKLTVEAQYLVTFAVCAALGWMCGAAVAQGQDQEALLRKLSGDDANAVREAAEAVGNAPPKGREELIAATEAVKAALGTTKDAKAERAIRLALG